MAAATFVDFVTGVLTRKSAVETGPASAPAEQLVSTNASGVIDPTLLPGTSPGVSVISSENLAAGDFVNLYNNAGTLNVRKSDGSTTGKTASGFVLAATVSPAAATVYTSGLNNGGGVSGLTPGEVYMDGTTAGKASNTAPTLAGKTSQRLGIATLATAVLFQPYAPITLA